MDDRSDGGDDDDDVSDDYHYLPSIFDVVLERWTSPARRSVLVVDLS